MPTTPNTPTDAVAEPCAGHHGPGLAGSCALCGESRTPDPSAPFPIEWGAWRALWDEWITRQLEAGTLTRSTFRFPPANFLADEVLGVYHAPAIGQTVELSEVTFPDLRPGHRGDRVRYVGLTFGSGSGTVSGGLASTFEELAGRLFEDYDIESSASRRDAP
jgi:hypothetical protein